MKTKHILIALGALLVLSGCNRSDLNPGTKAIRLTARTESDTRATIHPTSGAFAWETGDVIAVHLSTGYADLELTSAGTGELAINNGASRDGYAIFPYSAAAGTAGVPSVTLPSVYNNVTAESAVKTPLPMIAVNDPDSDILYFRHVGGLLRLEGLDLPAGTTSVTVTFNAGLTGTFTVTAPGSTGPTIAKADATATNKTVTFNIAASAALPTALHIPIPCGEYVGVTITAGTYSRTISDGFVVNRHQGIKLTVPSAPDPEP